MADGRRSVGRAGVPRTIPGSASRQAGAAVPTGLAPTSRGPTARLRQAPLRRRRGGPTRAAVRPRFSGVPAQGRLVAAGRRSRARAPSTRRVRRPADPRGDHRPRARPLGQRPAEGAARQAGAARGPPPGRGRRADRQRPGDGVPAHAGRPRPCVAARRGARGDRRGGVRRRPLRRGARRAARRQADERRHRLPADHGRLPPRARPPRAGAQAGQEPGGGELQLRRPRRR